MRKLYKKIFKTVDPKYKFDILQNTKLLEPKYDDAYVGITIDLRVMYDYDKVHKILKTTETYNSLIDPDDPMDVIKLILSNIDIRKNDENMRMPILADFTEELIEESCISDFAEELPESIINKTKAIAFGDEPAGGFIYDIDNLINDDEAQILYNNHVNFIIAYFV